MDSALKRHAELVMERAALRALEKFGADYGVPFAAEVDAITVEDLAPLRAAIRRLLGRFEEEIKLREGVGAAAPSAQATAGGFGQV